VKRVLVTPPQEEPVSLEDVRMQCRIDSHEEDSFLERKIIAARETAEDFLWQRLITQVWDQYYDNFYMDWILRLDLGPVQSVQYVRYRDYMGNWQTLDPSIWELGDDNGVGLVRRQYGKAWPATYGVPDAVIVRHTVGYGDEPRDVPEAIKSAIAIHAGHHFRYRLGEPVPAAFEDLLTPLSARRFRV
jgi:uncharacterized phiE125 gp8 family phage protein